MQTAETMRLSQLALGVIHAAPARHSRIEGRTCTMQFDWSIVVYSCCIDRWHVANISDAVSSNGGR